MLKGVHILRLSRIDVYLPLLAQINLKLDLLYLFYFSRMGQGTSTRENTNQVNRKSKEEDQVCELVAHPIFFLYKE